MDSVFEESKQDVSFEISPEDILDSIFDPHPDAEMKCYEHVHVKKRDDKLLSKRKEELDKFLKTQGFRLNSKTLFLTYPQCPMAPIDALD